MNRAMRKMTGSYRGVHRGQVMRIDVKPHEHGLEIVWEDGMRVTVDNEDTAALYLEQDSAERRKWWE